MKSLIYTGIGSRETPAEVLGIMTKLARWLAKRGWILRSGGADGADKAFEKGASKKEIYLPWAGFNGSNSMLTEATKDALNLAPQYHPAWDRLSEGAKKLHARNCHQILGVNLDTPSSLVICYTKDGKGQGGTGQALRLAKDYNIPIFDFGFFKSTSDAREHFNSLYKTITQSK